MVYTWQSTSRSRSVGRRYRGVQNIRMGCNIPTLPPELTDHIIDFLHDDRQALQACALVSRAWLPSAQLHLFYDIQIDQQNRAHIESILHQNPHLGEFVRKLSLHFGWGGIKPEQASFVIAHLPSVRELQLSYDGFLNISVFPIMGGVARVSLVVIGSPVTFSDLAQIMRTFPGLQDLCLHTLQISYPAEPSPIELSLLADGLASLHLRRLELCGYFSVFFAFACARSRPLTRLQEVSAYLSDTAEVPGMLSLLQSCCETLRKLEINTACSEVITVPRDQLHHFTTTTYPILLELAFETTTWNLRAVVELLRILPCPRISSLRFTFSYSGFPDSMDSDLVKISEILQQDRFAGLANLTIRFPNPSQVAAVGTSDQVRDLQTRIFGPFIERGIVKFEH